MEPDPPTSAPRRVEAYLDAVLAPLASRLSPFQQSELRRELREHLWARIDAYHELGQSEAEAVTEALQQFGGAEDFLKQWHQEWKRPSSPLTLRAVWAAGKSALRPSFTGILGVNLLYLVVQECIWHFPSSPVVRLMDGQSDAMGWSMAALAFLLLPIVIGTNYGKRTPERATAGIVAALAAGMVVTALLYGVAALVLDAGATTGITVTDMLFNFLLGLQAAWIPIAGGAAAFSSGRARRQRKVLT